MESVTPSFAFIVENIGYAYSGAKIKKDHKRNNYTIELKVSYFQGTEKKEATLSPITIQLVKVNDTFNPKDGDGNYLYVTDKLPVSKDFILAEIEIKVIETNTAMAQAGKIKDIVELYGDDAKAGLNTVLNFYFEQQNQGDGDAN